MTTGMTSQEATTWRYIFPFGKGLRLRSSDVKTLGGKGQHLAEMSSIGLPVPPGFVITTEACLYFLQHNKELPSSLHEEMEAAIKMLESQMNAQFGSETNPLLVSVRSGAAISMPGMMDTVLDLGLNDRTVVGFAHVMQNERLAYDCYRRFLGMYSSIVYGVSRDVFAHALDVAKQLDGVEHDVDLSVDSLKGICQTYKELFATQTGQPFPQDVNQQLFGAVKAVFSSWDSERCTLYRQVYHVPNDMGTAVTVEAMVFGNRNDRSATGVGFTRNPSTGENAFYGEFLINAQGEDVVAGIRTPHPINRYQQKITGSTLASLEELMPETYRELEGVVAGLERHYHDMQDIEFTIDDGRLFILQTRSGKRTGLAAARMAVEMLGERLIDEKTALLRVNPEQIEQMLAPVFHPKDKERAKDKLVANGLNAGPGAASGCIALTSAKATAYKQQGVPCILVRKETNPDDFPGIVAAEGILTARGGATSHAAVVARGMGKPCVVGCGSLTIDLHQGTVTAGTHTVKEGDPISIDGTTGEVFFCPLTTSPSEVLQVLLTKECLPENSQLYHYYSVIMQLADKYRTLKVRANADTAHDALIARAFGAEGIGLCRTEHMFMDEQGLLDVRRTLFSIHEEERDAAAEKLLPHQKGDFKRIFRSMSGLPVTIRLLDPPLHEFLPQGEEELREVAQKLGIPDKKLINVANTLREHNPMLGFRGCRLGILNPSLTRMQARAIFEAAAEVILEGGQVHLEIMVPLVGITSEFLHQKMLIDRTAKGVFESYGLCVLYSVGTMIELPRAALLAGQIAEHAEFFSFGTNDLTQTSFGMSRDDSGHFLPAYIQGVPNPEHPDEKMHLVEVDPFQVIDQEGVGQLIHTAIERGRKTRPHLKCGICGEHGGNAESVEFFHRIGIDYVSCSPYRVPVARLAAARAAVKGN